MGVFVSSEVVRETHHVTRYNVSVCSSLSYRTDIDIVDSYRTRFVKFGMSTIIMQDNPNVSLFIKKTTV
jgi:hypothetical protein